MPFFENDSWGYMDLEGRTVVHEKFQEAREFAGEFAVARFEGKYGFIGKNGEAKIAFGFD